MSAVKAESYKENNIETQGALPWLSSLYIKNFRNHETLSLRLPSAAPVVLTGANGAGKTSLLEAISLLGPGRGLRQASPHKIIYDKATQPLWGLSAKLMQADSVLDKVNLVYAPAAAPAGPAESDTKYATKVKINDHLTSALSLTKHLSLFWLTPAMARFFSEGSSRTHRRKFMDRLVMAVDREHASRLADFERLKRQRQALFENNQNQGAWLDVLEGQMAELAVLIEEARVRALSALNKKIQELSPEEFPIAEVSTDTYFEGASKNFEECVAALQARFAQARARDRATQRTHCGPHHSDFHLFNKTQHQVAQECSTGEVKALLVTLILAVADLSASEFAPPPRLSPIILLDEIAAHLDERRRFVLFNRLRSLSAQLWLTGTDPKTFASLKMDAHFFNIQPSLALPQ